MQITIPVSIFSLRVLAAKYGAGAIKLRKSDFMFKALCYTPVRIRTSQVRLDQLLSNQATFDLNAEMAKRLQNEGHQAGYFIHKMHMQELFTFVEAQIYSGVQAKAAIECYLKKNAIEEEDYSFDSAYKAFQRFKKNNARFRTKFRQVGSRVSKNETSTPIPPQIDKKIGEFASEIVLSLYTSRGKFRDKFFAQMICYFHLHVYGTPVDKVCAQYDMPRSSVYYAANAFQQKLKEIPALRHKLHVS